MLRRAVAVFLSRETEVPQHFSLADSNITLEENAETYSAVEAEWT